MKRQVIRSNTPHDDYLAILRTAADEKPDAVQCVTGTHEKVLPDLPCTLVFAAWPLPPARAASFGPNRENSYGRCRSAKTQEFLSARTPF